MTSAAVHGTGRPPATRRRLLAAALNLFSQYGFAGTSLQMIADELDLTKAAIYYHFRTREQLLVALMHPIFGQLSALVAAAEGQRGARTRAKTMLAGYADIVSGNRALAGVTTFDPSVRSVLRNQPEWSSLIDRQLALLSASGSGAAGAINATVALTGLAGAAAAASSDLDDDTLRGYLIETGGRVLGLSSTPGR